MVIIIIICLEKKRKEDKEESKELFNPILALGNALKQHAQKIKKNELQSPQKTNKNKTLIRLSPSKRFGTGNKRLTIG